MNKVDDTIYKQKSLYYQIMYKKTKSDKNNEKYLQNNNLRYEVIEQLSDSPWQVMKVRDRVNQQTKIQKVIKIMSKQQQQQLINEAQFLIKLSHPNLIKIFDYYVQQQRELKTLNIIRNFHLILQNLGQGYQQLKNQLYHLKKTEIFAIYQQLKSALKYLNHFHILYRQMNSRAIYINKLQNKTKIVLKHFGISKNLRLLHLYDTGIKEQEFYLAPQALEQQQNKKSDLWSIGIVVYEMGINKTVSDVYHKFPSLKMKEFSKFICQSNIDGDILKLILPLVQQNFKQRRFYQQQQFDKLQNRLDCSKVSKLKDDMLNSILINYLQLKQLICSNTLITDDCGKYIKKLQNLIKLDVSGNQISNKFTQIIKQRLPKMKSLNFCFTNISDPSLQLFLSSDNIFNILHIKPDSILQQLDISYTKVSTQAASNFFNKIKSIRVFRFWSGKIYPPRYNQYIFPHFGKNYTKYMYNETAINQSKLLNKANLQEITVNFLENGNKLVKNNVRCFQISSDLNEKYLQRLINKKQLNSIFLKNITKFQFNKFQSNQLKSVGLVNCSINFTKLLPSLSNLQSLNLSQNKLTDQLFIKFQIKDLKHLNLRMNNIGSRGVRHISQQLKQLIYLDLARNEVGIEGAISISNNLIKLQHLNLNMNKVEDKGIMQICLRLQKLRSLQASWNRITSIGVIEIVKCLMDIEYLNLNGNKIGSIGAKKIGQLYNLSGLKLWQCELSEESKQYIRSQLKNTKIWM